MEQSETALVSEEAFDFALTPAGLVTVAHREQQLRWDFIVERANGRRFLQPMKTRMNAIDRRTTAPLRRLAFAYAVAQARGRDVID